MAKKDPHIHRYKRVKLKDSVVFKCTLPGCRHYLRAILAEGALAQCNRCNERMILTKRNMKLARPHCNDCYEHKDKRIDSIKEILGDILP